MAKQLREKVDEGIYLTHKRGCGGVPCKCSSYQATVYYARDKRLQRKSFATKKEAKNWRGELSAAAHAGAVRAPSKTTFNDAADELLLGMKDGTIKNRSGRRYKPSTIRR